MSAPILWVIVLGFLLGVSLHSIYPLGISFVCFLIVLASALLILVLGTRLKVNGIVAVVALLALASGVLRMDAARLIPPSTLQDAVGTEIELEGLVVSEPDEREASTRLSVRLSGGVGVLVVAPAHAAVSYGDIVRAKGMLTSPESFETGFGREFNYPAYLAKDGISYQLSFVREIETVGRGHTNPLKRFAIWTKQQFLTGLSQALPEPQAGLAGGITAGDKRGLGEDLSGVFRTVSLTHIVVLSGYNIMIVVLGLGWLLHKSHAPRVWKLLLGIGLAVLFALVTGLASASVRAAAMASIALIGQYTGRLYMAARALALVALAMVVWNPFILVFDPGFQLSIIATAGLIVLTPNIIPRLTWVTARFNVREIVATSLAAQIAVLPLLLYQNGEFPLYALPANLAALIVVPWAMLFSAVASLGGLMLGSLGIIIAFPAYVLLSYLIAVANFFAALPYASITMPSFGAWWLLVVYGAMLLWTVRYGRTRKTT